MEAGCCRSRAGTRPLRRSEKRGPHSAAVEHPLCRPLGRNSISGLDARGSPRGREVLVIHSPEAQLGLDKANSVTVLSTPDFSFSIVCPPAPSYSVEVAVTNTLAFPWHLEGPCPVYGAWHWSSSKGEGQRIRFRLPHDLEPEEAAAWQINVKAPADPGRYRLSFTLLQERSVWFDSRPDFQAPLFQVKVSGAGQP